MFSRKSFDPGGRDAWEQRMRRCHLPVMWFYGAMAVGVPLAMVVNERPPETWLGLAFLLFLWGYPLAVYLAAFCSIPAAGPVAIAGHAFWGGLIASAGLESLTEIPPDPFAVLLVAWGCGHAALGGLLLWWLGKQWGLTEHGR